MAKVLPFVGHSFVSVLAESAGRPDVKAQSNCVGLTARRCAVGRPWKPTRASPCRSSSQHETVIRRIISKKARRSRGSFFASSLQTFEWLGVIRQENGQWDVVAKDFDVLSDVTHCSKYM